MQNLNCNQIKTFINLKIIGEEDKNKNCIYFFFNLKKFIQFGEATWRNHSF